MLKRKVQAYGLLMGLPLFFLLMLGGGGVVGTASATQQALRTAAERSDVPPELLPTLKELASKWNADWLYLAAFIRTNYTWQFPIKSRVERYHDWEQEQDEKCEEEAKKPDAMTPPVETPTDPPAEPPAEPPKKPPCHRTPPSRPAIEAAWRQDAAHFIETQLQVIWEAATPAEVQDRPKGAFRQALQAWVPPTQWREIVEYHDIYEAWYSVYDGTAEQDLGEAVEWENGSLLLSVLDWPYAFPVQRGPWDFSDDWGNDRPQNKGYTSTRHHGTDIMAPEGTPLVAVDRCTVFHRGWNFLGGWTITLQCPTGANDVYFYYAHASAYAAGTDVGSPVTRGQVIAYVGDTGEGPEGHAGNFAPHLHFGVYLKPDGWVTNPYLYLLRWQTAGSR